METPYSGLDRLNIVSKEERITLSCGGIPVPVPSQIRLITGVLKRIICLSSCPFWDDTLFDLTATSQPLWT